MTNEKPTAVDQLLEAGRDGFVLLHAEGADAVSADVVARFTRLNGDETLPDWARPTPDDDLADLGDGVQVAGVIYEGSAVRGTRRTRYVRRGDVTVDPDRVEQGPSQAQPQKPANAFLPLTTTEQVERRDAIKAKLMRKRTALSQRTA